MSSIVTVLICMAVLVGGVVLYSVIATATGVEEDKNQNYIPDWIERKFPSIFKSSKDLDNKEWYSYRISYAHKPVLNRI